MTERAASGVRFEVLGPLRAWRGEERLGLGPVQQRIVLAVLLLNANQPMGRDQIIHAVWGDAAPTYAVNLLQKNVSGLRRALDPAGPGGARSGMLNWTDGHYQLTVRPGDLDLTVFEEQVARARVARAAGDLPTAAEALHAATGLWRGPMCDGLTSPLLDTERSRLAERNITTVEDRIEVDLALGNVDLIAELRQLRAEHPLREKLHGQLMLALYRSGRQAEALTTYREAREQLIDDLGVEPGADLQRLHRQILAADPALAPAPPAAVVATAVPGGDVTLHAAAPGPDAVIGPPIPAQLPPAMPYFTGRSAELDQLHRALQLTEAQHASGLGGAILITAITGAAGVGKSALAMHWAHQVRDHFPDGQLYVNLRGFEPSGPPIDPAEAILGFLDAFAVPPRLIPPSLAARVALYRSLLDGRRVLVVADNARDADQVRPLLPGSPGCLVVVASRSDMSGLVAAEGAQRIILDLLSDEQARELLAGRLGLPRMCAEPAAVQDVVASCAGLPLALTVVAARFASRPGFSLAVLADQLRQAAGSLDAFDSGDLATDVRAVFSWSYRLLPDPAARLFRVLGLHPGPHCGVAAAANLAGIRSREAAATLASLTRVHLVDEQAPGRFALHDLLRAYAAERLDVDDTETDRHTALHRMLDYYLHSASAADGWLSPHRDRRPLDAIQPGVTPESFADETAALTWFTVEHAALLALVERAADAGFDAHACELAWTLITYFDRRGHWHDSATVLLIALGAAQRLADPRAEATVHRGLARACIQLDHDDEGRRHLQRALALYDDLDDDNGRGRTYHNFAALAARAGDPRRALAYAEQALTSFTAAGNRVGQADALNAIGWFHAQLGGYEPALDYCRRALTLHRAAGDRDGEAYALDSLGFAHHHLGDDARAIGCYEQARVLWRDVGDQYREARTLVNLGDIHQSAGDTAAAAAAWRPAMAILDEFGHPDANLLRSKLDVCPASAIR